MTIYARPDEVIFASNAKQGEVVTFPDLTRGWGVTIDQTNKIPPMEWFNFTGNRLDKAINYLLQTGVPEHNARTEYPKGAVVQSSGKIYIALQQNTNKAPQYDTTNWANLTPPASTSKAGVVALSNETSSLRSDVAATPLALSNLSKDTNSKINEKANKIHRHNLNDINGVYRVHYPNHYEGAEVYKFLSGGMCLKIQLMRFRVDKAEEIILLPERFTGLAVAMVIDVGAARHSLGCEFIQENKVRVFNISITEVALIAIGFSTD